LRVYFYLTGEISGHGKSAAKFVQTAKRNFGTTAESKSIRGGVASLSGEVAACKSELFQNPLFDG
jgi:hypothetical protein